MPFLLYLLLIQIFTSNSTGYHSPKLRLKSSFLLFYKLSRMSILSRHRFAVNQDSTRLMPVVAVSPAPKMMVRSVEGLSALRGLVLVGYDA